MGHTNFTKFTNDFKMPLAGRLGSNSGGGGSVMLWSSSPNAAVDHVWARYFNMVINNHDASANAFDLRAHGIPVRCFKNDEIKTIYTLTLNAGT
jgi:hypothetical protein